MRPILTLMLALTTAACASQQPHRLADRSPPPGHRGPPGSGGGSGRLLFISPVGEPFRSGPGAPDPERAWFDGADTDHDGKLTPAEFNADAMRFFAMLDRGHDGEIDPDDIDFYENQLVPEVRTDGGGGGDAGGRSGGRSGRGARHGGGMGGGGMVGGGMGGGRGGMGGGGPGGAGHGGGGASGTDGGGERSSVPTGRQGAARYSYLDFPEPITAMDTNFNRGIDRNEMATAAAARFATLDRNGDGVLERGELPHAAARSSGMGPGGGHRGPPPMRREDEPEPDRD